MSNRNSKPISPAQVVAAAGLAAMKHDAEHINPAALETFLHGAQEGCFAFELRMKHAQFAGDTKRINELKPELEKFQKRKAYYEKEIAAQFPQHKPAPSPNLKMLERQIVLQDYLGALELKRNAQIASKAAKALGDKDEEKVAFLDMQRALKYIELLEPKFKRYEREMKKELPS